VHGEPGAVGEPGGVGGTATTPIVISNKARKSAETDKT
jgi:hypothetical protein